VPETLVREYKYKPEDFLKKREADFLAGREGNTISPIPYGVPVPPTRRARFPSLAGLKPAKLPIKTEKPRRAPPDYLCFDDGIRHLLAISSTQD
jgi:hypothetical protein